VPDEYRFKGLELRVAKHDRDLYEGNGKPAITIRLAELESYMNDSKDRLKSIDKKFSAIISLLLATLAGVIVDIATKR
jgi:hypothetical protein